MRLVFFGSGAFGCPTFERLVKEHQVPLVVTQPDRPAGRNQIPTQTPIAQLAQQPGIRTVKPPDVNHSIIVETIRAVAADAFVVIAFGQKLGRVLLDGMFAINLHGSLLPKYRGAAPINWAMINGETHTGLSVITLADRMDAGDVLGQASTLIDPRETAGELHDRLSMMGPDLVLDVLRRFELKQLEPVKQDEAQVSVARKLTKADGTVSFDQPAVAVGQRVHGLSPWPGCTVRLGDRTLRLARVETALDLPAGQPPGLILPDFTIACKPGTIRPLEVQPPGGRVMSFRDYCNGQPATVGSRCLPL